MLSDVDRYLLRAQVFGFDDNVPVVITGKTSMVITPRSSHIDVKANAMPSLSSGAHGEDQSLMKTCLVNTLLC